MEQIKRIRKEKGWTQEELAASLGVQRAVISKYESGRVSPTVEQLKAIAEALGVTVLDLLGANTPEDRELREQDAKQTGKTLAEIEEGDVRDILSMKATSRLIAALEAADPAVVQAFAGIPDSDILIGLHAIANDELNRDGRILTLKRAYELAHTVGFGRFIPRSRYQAQPSASTTSTDTVYFMVPRFFHPMSAGVGVEAGNEQPNDLRLKKAPPRGTSYVAEVSGDSMEPIYHNGDLLFVRAQEMIELGQVGVFYMDGKQWVKRLGDGVLISHNPAYAPIPMREGIRCQGLVLGVCDESYLA